MEAFKVKKKQSVEAYAVKLLGSGEFKTVRGEIIPFDEGDYLITQVQGNDQWIVTADYYKRCYEAERLGYGDL